ncbi:MAG TPA: galactose oxidase early set domain-containing protein, partial [Gemmatimonadales bacterium]|nr:galactose oxidase early set domain-containing protein [Gemmatimonadales bacterium]
ASGLSDDFTAEIFSPPYLFNADGTPATRPVISSFPTTLAYGATFTIGTASAASIAKVTMIRLSSVTHSFNQNQRGNVLSFTVGSGALSVTAPLNGKLAPPGHYLLFIVNANGVPSIGKTVRIG